MGSIFTSQSGSIFFRRLRDQFCLQHAFLPLQLSLDRQIVQHCKYEPLALIFFIWDRVISGSENSSLTFSMYSLFLCYRSSLEEKINLYTYKTLMEI